VSPLGAAALFISPEAFQERPLWQELGGGPWQTTRGLQGPRGILGRDLEGSLGRSREGSFAGFKRDPLSWSGEILRLGQERYFAEVRKDPCGVGMNPWWRSGKILRGVGINPSQRARQFLRGDRDSWQGSSTVGQYHPETETEMPVKLSADEK
jgi:hypothetical protein